MMDFISIPATFGIGAYAFYKVIELFVRKKERLLLIEKLNTLENVNTSNINLSAIFGDGKIVKNEFLALRIGSLLMGLGLGLLVGFFIVNLAFGNMTNVTYHMGQTQSVVYGASTLLCGGLGLIVGFITEARMRRAK
ncbi:MAG: hypothetical protein EOM61_04710 [Bacteroidia bacterium]|jgi:hypothetical protein|uniref:DUF6249 domain-containing protein n=1 Tax=bioreactor metagenome TaxID=1076179 RepID=A0A644YLX9_9ZZZZ|nr:DUF6249 domain-containing protein [Rikenellaceae bacterium]NCB18903.1 hypothetical protein [Bacteroidia bacterium]